LGVLFLSGARMIDAACARPARRPLIGKRKVPAICDAAHESFCRRGSAARSFVRSFVARLPRLRAILPCQAGLPCLCMPRCLSRPPSSLIAANQLAQKQMAKKKKEPKRTAGANDGQWLGILIYLPEEFRSCWRLRATFARRLDLDSVL